VESVGERSGERLGWRWWLWLAEIGIRVALIVAVVQTENDFLLFDVGTYWDRFHALGLHHLPYRDFLWEFPPLTVAPAAIAALMSLKTFQLVFAFLMAACELASLHLVRRSRPESALGATVLWTVFLAPVAATAYFKLDFLSVLFGTIALVAVLSPRHTGKAGVAVVAIGLGFAAKLWPAAVAAVSVVQRRWATVVAGAAACAGIVVTWVLWSPSGFADFLSYRHGSGFQLESVPGGVRLAMGATVGIVSDAYVVDADRFGWVDPLMFVALAVSVAALVALAWRRGTRDGPSIHLPALVGCLVTLSMLFSRILSPQYLVWLLPFVVVAALDGERLAAVSYALASACTGLILWRYSVLVAGGANTVAILLVRNALLIAVAIGLGRFAFVGQTDPS